MLYRKYRLTDVWTYFVTLSLLELLITATTNEKAVKNQFKLSATKASTNDNFLWILNKHYFLKNQVINKAIKLPVGLILSKSFGFWIILEKILEKKNFFV